jgi:hypothetical protein
MRVSEAFPENDEPDTATALIRNYDDACTLLSVTVDEINIETGESPGQGIVSYNDYSERTHAEMIRLFDRAIAAAPRN